MGNQQISISGEEDIFVTQSPNASYVDATENAWECSYRAFEFVNTTYIGEGSKLYAPHLSTATEMVVKQTMGKGWCPGVGLGRNHQGIKKVVTILESNDRFRLGDKPTWKDKAKKMEEKKERRIAQLKGDEFESEKLVIPYLYDTFCFSGYQTCNEGGKLAMQLEGDFSDLSIHMIDEKILEESVARRFVYWTLPRAKLKNWTILEFPEISFEK